MLACGGALAPTRLAVVGGTVQLELSSTSVSPNGTQGSGARQHASMPLRPGASRDISVYRLRSNGSLCRTVCGEMPMPLAGHCAAVDRAGCLWTYGGYSSAQMAPQCLCRVTFSTESCTPTTQPGQTTASSAASNAGEDDMTPADTASTSSAVARSTEPRPSTVDVFNADDVCIFGASAMINDASSAVEDVWLIWGGLTSGSGSIRLAHTSVARAFFVGGESPRTERVRQSGDVPSPRAGAAMVARGNRVLLVGGRNGSNARGDFYIGTISRCVTDGAIEIDWEQQRTSNTFASRAGHTLLLVPGGKNVLVLGGWSLAATTPEPVWRPSNDAWIGEVPQLAAEATASPSLTASPSGKGGRPAPLDAPLTFKPTGLQLDPQHASNIAFVPMDFGFAIVVPPSEGVPASEGTAQHKFLASSSKTRFVRWGSAELSLASRTVTPPPERDPNIRFIAHYPSLSAPVAVVLKREGLTIGEIKKHVMKACEIPRTADPNNFLMDYVDNNGGIRPLHMPDILHAVLSTDQENIVLHAVIEEPPKSFQPVYSNPIGKGTFGTVYRAINQADNTSFCLKRVKVDHSSPSALEALQAEIRMMRQLRHENLVKYLGSQMSGDKVYIFMELVAGDTLERLCRSIPLTNRQIQLIVKQVLQALEFLHSYNVVHRDIKGANVLFDAQGVVKVSDFGTAKHLNPLSTGGSNRPAGTILYMAPEIMRGEVCHTAADMWSLGCLIIEMASGQHPFHERNFSDGIQVINAVGVDKYKPRIPDRLSTAGRDLVERCLNFEPAERPSATELLGHEFVIKVEPEDAPTQLAHTMSTPTPQATAMFQAQDTLAETDLRPEPGAASLKAGKPRKLHPKPKP